jgi:hypothetical protein
MDFIECMHVCAWRIRSVYSLALQIHNAFDSDTSIGEYVLFWVQLSNHWTERSHLHSSELFFTTLHTPREGLLNLLSNNSEETARVRVRREKRYSECPCSAARE